MLPTATNPVVSHRPRPVRADEPTECPVHHRRRLEPDRALLRLVSPAQRTRGIRSQAVMSWVAFCPTILEWCRVEHAEGDAALSGRLFLPILEDDGPHPGGGAWEETFFSHCIHKVTSYYPGIFAQEWRKSRRVRRF
ncbi:MAG: hypothetical protein OXQ31_25435, partial [Spirochaetaceae bacterium]|nr:hypothetical protein [Spirochaetaceae bacterium]